VFSIQGFAQPFGWLPYRKGDAWGYSDSTGRIVLEPKYDRTYFFSPDGLARVKTKGRYGFIDQEGKLVIVPSFLKASDFLMGVAQVETKNKKFCINLEGEEDECPLPEEEMEPEDDWEPLSVVQDNHAYRLLINETNDTLSEIFSSIKIVRKSIFPKPVSFALVQRNKSYGAYDEQGKIIAPIEFEAIEFIDMEFYMAKKNNKWGVQNFSGDLILPFEFDSITKVPDRYYLENPEVRNDHFIVFRDKKYGIIDSRKNIIADFSFDYIQKPEGCSCPTQYVVKKENKVGLLDYKGDTLIPLKYSYIEPFYLARFTMVKDAMNKEGYISRKGKEFFE
jgi:hypothetical protein